MEFRLTVFAAGNFLYFCIISYISCFDEFLFIQLNVELFYYKEIHESLLSTSKISCINECKTLDSTKTCTHVALKPLGNGRVECLFLDADNATNNIFSEDGGYELWANGKNIAIIFMFSEHAFSVSSKPVPSKKVH